MAGEIIIRGARLHNLKNITVRIPKEKLVVITGLSGSGKSALAFETLHREGQRQYLESLGFVSYGPYVLDELTVGLHQRDTGLLMEILRGLRDLGNTAPLSRWRQRPTPTQAVSSGSC